MSVEVILEVLLQAIPHPHLVKQIHLEPDAVRFTWRGARYRIDAHLGVEEVGDGVLIGSDRAILLARALRLAATPGPVLPA